MCIADLYDYDPKRRAKLASLESLICMRDAVREADAINRSMPSAVEPTPVRDPCTHPEPTAAGAYQEKAA